MSRYSSVPRQYCLTLRQLLGLIVNQFKWTVIMWGFCTGKAEQIFYFKPVVTQKIEESSFILSQLSHSKL